MNNIAIGAMSDTHGLLPKLNNECDLLCICGDVFPQSIERNIEDSRKWFYGEFLSWVMDLPCTFVIMIPGNHCFYLESEFKENGRIVLPDALKDKCVCLVDESFSYQGLLFYGTSWVTNLPRWAFNTDDPESKFEKIPYDCDILLTHHAPDYGKLGCSYPNTDKEKNFGSTELAKIIQSRSYIKYHFCGHIHTGTHGGVRIGNAMSYNVSLLDEQYQLAFKETYIRINSAEING